MRRQTPKEKLVARYNWATGRWADGSRGRRYLHACARCGAPMFSCAANKPCHGCRRMADAERREIQRTALRRLGLIGTKERKPAPSYKVAQRRAISLVSVAKMNRKLPCLDGSIICVDCKRKPAAVYDHRDYSKPLEVEPVCHWCNGRRGPALWSVPTVILTDESVALRLQK